MYSPWQQYGNSSDTMLEAIDQMLHSLMNLKMYSTYVFKQNRLNNFHSKTCNLVVIREIFYGV